MKLAKSYLPLRTFHHKERESEKWEKERNKEKVEKKKNISQSIFTVGSNNKCWIEIKNDKVAFKNQVKSSQLEDESWEMI